MIAKTFLKPFLPVVLCVTAGPCLCQSGPDLEKFFRQDIGLSDDQISTIRNGQPVAKALPPRTPSETLLFAAVYIHARPEAYFQYARNFDRLRKMPSYLGLGIFTTSPQLSDLQGFTFDDDDVQALKNCEPGNCRLQLPLTSIEELHRSIQWSDANVDQQVNQLLQRTALERVLAYQHEGNPALGVYNDKAAPIDVPQEFAYLLSYDKALSAHEPDFYHYLLSYPGAKPANYEETFYWEKVKFGLKPTLRIVHMVTMRGGPSDPIANAIARKQLYASHYFQTALDLSICVRDGSDPKHPGFFLIQVMGSEQAGLNGVKGLMIRSAAEERAVSNLQTALAKIKSELETER